MYICNHSYGINDTLHSTVPNLLQNQPRVLKELNKLFNLFPVAGIGWEHLTIPQASPNNDLLSGLDKLHIWGLIAPCTHVRTIAWVKCYFRQVIHSNVENLLASWYTNICMLGISIKCQILHQSNNELNLDIRDRKVIKMKIALCY